jgi:hypothetical protein
MKHMKELDGYRKLRATDLDEQQQAALRRALQHDLAAAMVRAVRESPPEIDLADVEVVLTSVGGGGWQVAADCGTCGTCVTCVTCLTS